MLAKDRIYGITGSIYYQISVLVILCYLSYGSSLNGSFVFDDTVAIKQNKAISFQPTNYTAIFTSDFWGTDLSSKESHKSYRPLTSLMFHFEWIKWHWDPFHMKCFNVMLHTINSTLVLIVLRKFHFAKSGEKIAFIAAVFFSVHPVHTEAVAGIVSRADLMFCLIYLICLLISSSKWSKCFGQPILIVMLCCIGVLFKETSITIPLACISLAHKYELTWQQQLKELFNKVNIFYGISTITIVICRLWLANFKSPEFKRADNPISKAPQLLTRIYSQSYLYVYNFKILLDPWHLCFDWSFDCIQLIESFRDCRLLPVLVLYICLIVLLLNYKRNLPAALAVFGLMVVPFLPASGIVLKVGFVIAERVLYVPSIGYCYLVGYGYVRLCDKAKCRKFIQFGFGLVVLIFVLRCRQRSSEWLTEETLFASALKVCPNNAKVHYNIARLATDVKNKAKAFHHYHQAIELAPDYDAALMNLGNLYRENGNFQEAEKYLERSLEITPDFATAWMNLGIVQATTKNYKKALQSYRNALKFRKNYANCYYNMGNLYLEQKLYTEALNHWRHAIALKPGLRVAWTNMLTMLDSKGLYEDFIRTSEQALKYLPEEPSILFLRANVFGKVGRYVEAEKLYKQVIAKEPLNSLYHTNLGVLYHRWVRLTEAVDAYKRAIDVDPQKATTARENLSKLINLLAKQKKESEG